MPVTNYYSASGQIYAEETSGIRTDYLTDPLGSVIATMNAAGQLVNTYRYKPYGGLLAKTGNGPAPSFQWVGSLGYRQTGKKWSDVYVRARHYDTEAGRWTGLDPVWRALGFAYVAMRPVSMSDPTGMEPQYIGQCPEDQIRKPIRELCAALAKLSGEPAGDLEFQSINTCIADVAKRAGVVCPELNLRPGITSPSLSARRLKCLQNFCQKGVVYCDPSEEEIPRDNNPCCLDKPPCGAGPEPVKDGEYIEDGKCKIAVCKNAYQPGSNCGDKGAEGIIPPGAFEVFHEATHCCGVRHGTRRGRGDPLAQCNDIVACCILARLFPREGRSPQERCRRQEPRGIGITGPL